MIEDAKVKALLRELTRILRQLHEIRDDLAYYYIHTDGYLEKAIEKIQAEAVTIVS